MHEIVSRWVDEEPPKNRTKEHHPKDQKPGPEEHWHKEGWPKEALIEDIIEGHFQLEGKEIPRNVEGRGEEIQWEQKNIHENSKWTPYHVVDRPDIVEHFLN